MKIARFHGDQGEAWGVVDGETIRPLIGTFADWAPKIAADGPQAASLGDSTIPLSSVRLLAPVTPTTRVFGTGINYRSHTDIAGAPIRANAAPCFMVPLEAVIGPDDEIRYPDITNQFDYEIELVCVMGGPVRDSDHAFQAVLGYTIGSDTSARDAGMPPGLPTDLFTMKGMDGTRPLGPWIVTRDEFGGDVQPAVYMTTTINGERRQHDTTASMAWDVPRCVNWLNARTALKPGDLVTTGTCGGTAVENEMREPGTGRFLQPGDEIEFAIEGIGVLRNTVGKKSPNHVGYPTTVADARASR
jgi:2-keto-4-pentenoate hydratase/2-oxohepta-3-ene-1,7-dioic acid hydratase in catechol pathway